MAQFTQYAIAATEMALEDAGWRPNTQEEKEMTGVCLGSGIGNLEELYDTSIAYEKYVSAMRLENRMIAENRARDIKRYHRYLCPSYLSIWEPGTYP